MGSIANGTYPFGPSSTVGLPTPMYIVHIQVRQRTGIVATKMTVNAVSFIRETARIYPHLDSWWQTDIRFYTTPARGYNAFPTPIQCIRLYDEGLLPCIIF